MPREQIKTIHALDPRNISLIHPAMKKAGFMEGRSYNLTAIQKFLTAYEETCGPITISPLFQLPRTRQGTF